MVYMQNNKQTILELPEKVYLTVEAKKELRYLKTKLKKSMAQITIDLIHDLYTQYGTEQKDKISSSTER